MIDEAGEQVVVVVSGGGPPDPGALAGLPPVAVVIAADSGLAHAEHLGLAVDLVVGDLDSVAPDVLARAEAAGTEVDRHPAAKDATDLELALDRALATNPDRIVVVGDDGGRLDHLLAGVSLLASDRWASTRVEARLGAHRLTVVRGPTELHGAPGDIVTLLPQHGPALGVTTDGLEYPLRGEDLPPGTTRGVSNVLLGTSAHVDLAGGVLVAIQPPGRP